MADKLIRCFIAIELQREAVSYIQEVQQRVKKKNLFYGKFTEPENLHLTLKFLGEIPEGQVKEVQERLRSIQLKRFEASLGELGLFSKSFLRILWIKINGKQIWELQSEIDKALFDMFPKEERFMSHLTIARIKKVTDKKSFFDYVNNLKHKEIRFQINEFVLKRSELSPEGPEYSALEKYSSHPP